MKTLTAEQLSFFLREVKETGVYEMYYTELATGLRRVFISLGGDGMLAADHKERLHVPCCPGEMVNTTGCGDAGMAAIAWAYLEGTNLEGTAKAAMAAGAIAMESAETINQAMSAQRLRDRMK